jgi:hypothetical protein
VLGQVIGGALMQRSVASMPLAELWDDAGPVVARRGRDLTAQDIRGLLRAGRVQFVVADIGAPLRWVRESECFAIWKSEVEPHLAVPAGADLGEFPGEYCYFASEWISSGDTPVVLLERHH